MRAFSLGVPFNSSYAFTTFSSELRIQGEYGSLGCISASITPDIGSGISGLLTYVPLVILILAGVATAAAGIWSPWGGTADIFKWTSNYGRDEDLLRLVTPGFGDCLHYIQFVVLTGGLSLNYPGYYQPVVSQASWATLMFNRSFVSHGNGTQSLEDGIYTVNGTYGLDRLGQYVGVSRADDIWAGMIVWLIVILLAVVLLIQIGFAVRWLYRQWSKDAEQDLRAKNLPFSIGNIIRIVFNYFLLPIVSLSMYQLVIAGRSPAYVTALAAIVLLFLVGFSIWLLRVIAATRPRAFLFDDLPTVLLYGPLYNTYTDSKAPFALIPVFLTFVRGIAIGAVQPSGIAQIVILAICEVIFILTLIAFRPFHSPTSMNAYHTFFAITRLLTTLLGIAFVPSLGVTEAPKGWIGYAILLMHGIALIFGFFLNALQTIAELGLRHAGIGADGGAATRGGLVKVFGMRQLSRRLPRHPTGRQSALSGAGSLSPGDAQKSAQLNGRPRSLSGSSAKLLGRAGASDGRASTGLEQQFSNGNGPLTPSTPGALSTFSHGVGGASSQGGLLGMQTAAAEAADPYYRPPRARKPTLEAASPEARSGVSWASGDWVNRRWSQHSADHIATPDAFEGPSRGGTPRPAYLGSSQHLSSSNINTLNRTNTDYAVREVDFYYGVRGAALSDQPSRRLGTGPADPTGPVSSAAGWFKSLFRGKTKEKGKGFEVVRSARMPPAMIPRDPNHGANRGGVEEEQIQGETRGLALAGPSRRYGDSQVSDPEDLEDREISEGEVSSIEDDDDMREHRISDIPPSLPGIDTGGGIELPSRVGSKVSSRPPSSRRIPRVPRKSSKRNPAGISPVDASRLATIRPSPPGTPGAGQTVHRLRPSNVSSSRMPFGSEVSSTGDKARSLGDESTSSSGMPRTVAETETTPGNSHARHSSDVFGTLAPNIQDERPTSVGYVQQHRASDNIHRVRSNQDDHIGSTAEVVDHPAGARGSLND